jgi:hypothetical protein
MQGMLRALVEHLRENRSRITRTLDVQNAPNWSPTLGYSDGGSQEVEIVDLDALFEQIDTFAKTFKE